MRWILLAATCLMPLPSLAANVYDFAAETPGFTRFAALMRQTGIDRALSNPGPYTIFAPQDSAFAKLPAGLDRERLVQILTCHMAPTRALTDVLATGRPAVVRTVGGCRISMYRTQDGIMLRDDAGREHRLTAADIPRSNGVIHTVDSLILPAIDASSDVNY
ncbi:fasciclin domain-containing protein [Falsirhodobacter sp. 1013]|uniref:fasciclin domain-containing protein n=1 Tax=Falsirhodobacter sp. 1013 TaxID=3417566 RepID=UPI003EB9B489